MGIDIATSLERLMNDGNDRDVSWWPLVHCRPLRTERFGRRAVVASGAVTLSWVVGVIVMLPGIVLAYWVARGYFSPAVTWLELYLAFGWLKSSGWYDAILTASAIGWPLCLGWSAWAWNRRARRLSAASKEEIGVGASSAEVLDDGRVWPPAPRRPE